MQNNQPMMFTRDDKDVNISDEEYRKLMNLDPQGKREILEAYANGEWKPEG
jgi:hypothetical protein